MTTQATGRTLVLLNALVAHGDMTWMEMRDVLGSNRSLLSVYHRARDRGWIAMGGYDESRRASLYVLTTAGAEAATRPDDVFGGDR